jgi:hypothetical protein
MKSVAAARQGKNDTTGQNDSWNQPQKARLAMNKPLLLVTRT